jgi:hypothetical protein
VTIGTNVTVAADSFRGNFATVYANAGKAAGTYTYNGSTWAKTN